VEGFKPLDGLAFLEVTRQLTRAGKQVILYRAGRTEAGAHASASHTASIAGNYGVTRALCRQAGAILAESLTEFEDVTRLACALRQKNKLIKPRLAAMSNAGFECVTFADHLGPMTLAELSTETNGRLLSLFEKARIQQIVDLHNPLDLTPMCADADYEQVVETLLKASEVDAVILGCVPLTPALQTLPASTEGTYQEDMNRSDALAARLLRLWHSKEAWAQKPWVVVVDAGPLYDPFVNLLEQGGIPVFRSAERALNSITKLLPT
jgi:acyl-CoA synthetase (NDP forming)